MSKETAWLELFTGVAIDEPVTEERQQALAGAVAAAAAAQAAYERKKQAQADALAEVRGKLERIKAATQAVLSQKISSGPFKGKRFLDVQGGQIDEIDIEDVTAESLKSGKPPIPDDITQRLLSAGYAIGDLGRELREKTFKPDPALSDTEPLFSDAQLQAEFWAPIMRERIFPEGFTAAPWSATQRMLDETNALYEEMVEQKRLAGELTPERDFLKDSLETGGQLLSVGASFMGTFNSKDLELAKNILETGSEVLLALGSVSEKLKNSEFADAASAAVEIAGTLTGAALSGAGVDPQVAKAASGAFSAGSGAILLGKSLNQVRTGEANLSQALTQMGDVLGKALKAAGDAAGGDAAKGLAIAAKAAPTAFKAVGLGTDLPELVRNGDYQGVIERFADITKDVLSQLPGLDKLGVDPGQIVGLAATGLTVSISTAFAVKKGQYLAAFNGVVSGIGDSLGEVLTTAGVSSDLSDQIVSLYNGAASAPKALQLMATNPPKVAEAIEALAGGVESALAGSGDETLKLVGQGLATGVKSLVNTKKVIALYEEQKFDEAVELFTTSLEEGFGVLSSALGVESTDEEEEEEEGAGDDEAATKVAVKPRAKGDLPSPDAKAVKALTSLVDDLKKGVKVEPEQVRSAAAALQKTKDEEQAEIDRQEAQALLDQAELDLKAMTEAERTGAEASNIEQLIADLLRDRMILKLATQIAEGGAAFLAQFLPGLGAASAGIKLAASLYAAGQRAKQLDAWLQTHSDMKAAQSELSSSAANFVKNQGQQLAHYSAQAFFAAAQLAGEITKLAGPASGIGATISAAAVAGAKAEDLLMDLKKKYDVEAGWKATQKALRNPGNRRLGLEARNLNPTLAKYSLAWGAVVLKDPLARGAMKACGLTEAALKDETADAHKVVKYLEVFYEDDVTIYREAGETAPDWVPAEIEVSLMCWAAFRRGAQGVALQIAGASLVEGLLGEYEGVQDAASQTADALDRAQEAFTAAGNALRKAAAGAGNPDAAPTVPDTTLLALAIDAHTASLRTRSETAQRLFLALLGVKVTAGPGAKKGESALKAAEAAIKQFRSKAERVHKAAAIDATGLESAKLEMEGTVAALQRQIDMAKAAKATSEQTKPEKPKAKPRAKA